MSNENLDELIEEPSFVHESELERQFRREIEVTPRERLTTIVCGACKAETTLAERVDASVCVFCGASISAAPGESDRECIVPQYILPFLIDREQAAVNFRRWIRSRWFIPGPLKHSTKNIEIMSCVYLPFWLYGVEARTDFQGQRGTYYTTSRTYRDSNGRTQTEKTRHTRWSDASGTIRNSFKNLLVSGTGSVLKSKLDKLEPWGLYQLERYQHALPEGCIRELYNISVEQGLVEAHVRVDLDINRDVKKNIGGDTQRVTSTQTRYKNLNFGHVLLPTWVAGYRYKNKSFQFLVNARSGEVQGQRPWSKWKIAGLALLALGIALAVLVFYALMS